MITNSTPNNLHLLFPVVMGMQSINRHKLTAVFYSWHKSVKTEYPYSYEHKFELVTEQPIYCSINETDVYNQLEQCFINAVSNKTQHKGKQCFEQAMTAIDDNSRKGVDKLIYKNYIFYHGTSTLDRIAQIIKTQTGDYCLFIHPEFSKYVEQIGW